MEIWTSDSSCSEADFNVSSFGLGTSMMEEARYGKKIDANKLADLWSHILNEASKQSAIPATVDKNVPLRNALALYNNPDFTEGDVLETLWNMMVVPLAAKPNKTVANVMRFVAKYLVTVVKEFSVRQGPTPTKPQDFNCIEYLINISNATYYDDRTIVRCGIMKLVKTIVMIISDWNIIRPVIVSKLCSMLVDAGKDKSATVRADALYCFKNFMPEKYSTNIKKVMNFHFEYDPSPDVRASVAKAIELSKTSELNLLVKKLQDVSSNVRQAVMNRLESEVPFSRLSEKKIHKIVSICLQDETLKSQAAPLFRKWLDEVTYEVIPFLSCLNVFMYPQMGWDVLLLMYNYRNCEDFDDLYNKVFENGFPKAEISYEIAFLWAFLWEHFKNSEYCKSRLYISCSDYIDYLEKFIAVNVSNEELEERQAIFNYLLRIFLNFELEEGERRRAVKFVKELFASRLVDRLCCRPLLLLYHKFQDDDRKDEIFFILESLMMRDQGGHDILPECYEEEYDEQEEERRQLYIEDLRKEADVVKTKMFDLLTGLRNLRSEKLNFIQADKYLDAQRIKNIMDRQQEKIDIAKENLKLLRNQIAEAEANVTVNLVDGTQVYNDDVGESTIPSDRTLCVVTSCFMMHLRITNELDASSKAFLDKYIYYFLPKVNVYIRCYLIQTIAMASLLKSCEALTGMNYCLKALINERNNNVGKVALKSVFDLLLHYGFELFNEIPTIKTYLPVTVGVQFGTSKSIEELEKNCFKSYMLSFLRSSDIEEVKIAVLGLIRLTIADRLKSRRLVPTFLLLWANPANKESIMTHYVGQWVRYYALKSWSHCSGLISGLEGAFAKIESVPNDHPLKDACVEKLVALVMNAISAKGLGKEDDADAWEVHVEACGMALDALLDLEYASANMQGNYTKILKYSELKGSSFSSQHALMSRSRRVLQKEDLPPSVKNALKKFMTTLTKSSFD